jgi:DNA-binding XRE family transcriptional regulator
MLTLDSANPNPRSIPAAGTDVAVSFRFATNDAGSFSTRYTLTNQAYRFANATGGSGREVRIGARTAPGTSGFTDTLQVRGSGATGSQGLVVIRLEIQETGQAAQTLDVVLSILHVAVAAFREANDLSQADLAERAGVSRSTISRLEQGGTPSDETHEAIERVISEEAT